MQKKSITRTEGNLTFHEFKQGSEEWLRFREGYYTGSGAIKLLKHGATEKAKARNDGFKGNYYTKRGHLLEPEAIELYEQINNVKVQHTGCVTNINYPGCLYSPDGYLDDRTIEVKCFMPKHHLETIKKTDIPILAQCYFGQMIMERPLTDLLLYCPKPQEVPEDKIYVVKQIKHNPLVEANFKRKLGIKDVQTV